MKNVLAKVEDVRDCVIKKAVPLSVGAIGAMNALMITAFAEEVGGGTVDISSVTSAMTSSLADLVGKVALACAGVVGFGLTIYGIKWAIRTVKGFFSRIAG